MSTANNVAEPAVCPDHGFMIPINYHFALLNEDDMVIAILQWCVRDEQGPIGEMIAAVTEEALWQVPRLDGQVHVGNWAYRMQQEGRLVEYYDLTLAHPGVLGIADYRDGHGYSYTVYDGPELLGQPHLQPGVVYHWYVDVDEPDKHVYPRLKTFDEVMALANSPEAVWIRDPRGLEGKTFDDPDVVAQFGSLELVVSVEDEVCRNSTDYKESEA